MRLVERNRRRRAFHSLKRWLRMIAPPRPGISEPDRWQEIKLRGFRPTIRYGDLDTDIVRFALGVFNEHIEIPVIVEDPSIEKFKLRLRLIPLFILCDKLRIRECLL